MGGGGGDKQTSRTTSGISDEFKPYFEKALGIATNRLEGQFDPRGNFRDPSAGQTVAGLTGQHMEGMGSQQDLARQALQGSGMYDDRAQVQRMLQNASGAQDYGMQGSLGSARGDRAKQAALADMGYQFQQARQQNAEGGAQSLQDIGSTLQEQKQRMLDAPYTELQRFSNVAFGNAPTTSSTESKGGGGK